MEEEAFKFLQSGVRAAYAGDRAAAEFCFLKSLEIETHALNCLCLGGLLANVSGREMEAFRYFRRAVRCDPRSGDAYHECGAMLMRMGRVNEAQKWFRRALSADFMTRRHFALYNLAIVYKRWNRPERSRRYLYLALQTEPEFEPARQMLARLREADGV